MQLFLNLLALVRIQYGSPKSACFGNFRNSNFHNQLPFYQVVCSELCTQKWQGIGYTNDIVLHRFVILQHLFYNASTEMAWVTKNSNIYLLFNICLTMVNFIINYQKTKFFLWIKKTLEFCFYIQMIDMWVLSHRV